jgi:hypothetical protein
MIFRAPEEKGGVVPDFGRGSREQSQGRTHPDNVRPIRKPVEAASQD